MRHGVATAALALGLFASVYANLARSIGVDRGYFDGLVFPRAPDLAVTPLMASTVPEGLVVLRPESGLPPLPPFNVNLYLPKAGASDASLEFAKHIREQFKARYRHAA